MPPLKNESRKEKKVLEAAFEETGRKTLYAVNLTGRTMELKSKARKAAELGADVLLLNVFAYGLDVLQSLAEDDDIPLPIMAHPAVSGALTSSPHYGFPIRFCSASSTGMRVLISACSLHRTEALLCRSGMRLPYMMNARRKTF